MPEPVLPGGGRLAGKSRARGAASKLHMGRRARRRAADAEFAQGLKKLGINPYRDFDLVDLAPETLAAALRLMAEVEAKWQVYD